MSLRTTLIVTMIGMALLAMILLGFVGIWTVDRYVVREAQSRVDHDLSVVTSQYEREMHLLGIRFENRARAIDTASPDLDDELRRLRQDLGFDLLNLCDADGRPVWGAHTGNVDLVPVRTDPVLRRALQGSPARGTVLLEPERLEQEGGAALAGAMHVYSPSDRARPQTASALFRWFAYPLRDRGERVNGILYGGMALNHDYELVDGLRDLVVGTETEAGRPLGTVTVFLGDIRVNTNVPGPGGGRAVGTRVSEVVRHEVLEAGRRWSDRAWVVNDWYLSGYEPLRNPDGDIIGMLYVGLLESPYRSLRTGFIQQLLVPIGLTGLLGILVSLFIVGRLTRPLRRLGTAADRIARGEWYREIGATSSYTEVEHLSGAFRGMQRAIAERDRRLRQQNTELAETNDQLEQANANYMKMLGFVTHELKSPLATIQSLIDVLLADLYGTVPEKARHPLQRIKRNCEELQDMVKNYLDLTRAERGELVANPLPVDVCAEVLRSCTAMVQPLLESRSMTLETECPGVLTATIDPELLRIAIGNFLSNAAKYGREGGRVRLTAEATDRELLLTVWNEGVGFTPEEKERLFQKFTRVRNQNTSDKRGSGLGLWLARQVAELHGGTVEADAEPEEWARFRIRMPRSGVSGGRV
jgi:two-component system NtrC family sensor kinase